MNGEETRKEPEQALLAWAPILTVWLINSLVFLILFLASRYTVISEIRHHAMGVATAVASALSADDLASLRSVADQKSEAYQRVQHQLDHAVQFNPDIRYIYTMRRTAVPFSPSTAYEYVVDQPARDRNRDGVIGPDEVCEPLGKPYNASAFPAMLEAWQRPAADRMITADAPYPELLSGYAPVTGKDGQTVAIVGVDITAETVRKKLRNLLTVVSVLWLVMGVLGHVVVRFYQDLHAGRERDRLHSQELAARNELLRRALQVRDPPVSGRRSEAQWVLDRYDVKAVAAGPAIFHCFDLDHDRLAFLMAVKPPDATTQSLLRAAVDLLHEKFNSSVPPGSPALPYVDPARPTDVLDLLGRLLGSIQPDAPSPGLFYAVVDFTQETIVHAGQGIPPPIAIRASGAAYVSTANPAEPGLKYKVQEGDLLLVAGPGVEDEDVWLARVQATMGPALGARLTDWVSSLPDRPRLALFFA